MLADTFNYTQPPFYVVLLGTMGLVTLMIVFAFFRRVFFGMFGGGLGAAAIAWYVLGKGSGDSVTVGMMQLLGTPACGVFGALACGISGLLGQWVRRK